MKLMHTVKHNGDKVYSNKKYTGNSLDECNVVVITGDERPCYIKTTIGFNTIITTLDRVTAIKLIGGVTGLHVRDGVEG